MLGEVAVPWDEEVKLEVVVGAVFCAAGGAVDAAFSYAIASGEEEAGEVLGGDEALYVAADGVAELL